MVVTVVVAVVDVVGLVVVEGVVVVVGDVVKLVVAVVDGVVALHSKVPANRLKYKADNVAAWSPQLPAATKYFPNPHSRVPTLAAGPRKSAISLLSKTAMALHSNPAGTTSAEIAVSHSITLTSVGTSAHSDNAAENANATASHRSGLSTERICGPEAAHSIWANGARIKGIGNVTS